MTHPSDVFRTTYEAYLQQLRDLCWDSLPETLGIRVADHVARIPFLGRNYRVSPAGITDAGGRRPGFGICVVLLKHLLMCPKLPSLRKEWVTFRDFRDAAPLAGSFRHNVEHALSAHFSGRCGDLAAAAPGFGGQKIDVDIACDLALRFDALPKVPLFVIFNDADDEFPAACSVFFEERAGEFLDMECLAIAGMLLSDGLRGKWGGPSGP